jgi:hypothetical protein
LQVQGVVLPPVRVRRMAHRLVGAWGATRSASCSRG